MAKENKEEQQQQQEIDVPEGTGCEMCQFLFLGYKRAHSKQAKAEYGEGFLIHFTRHHHDVFGDI